jgi:hypothetical protein
MDQVDVHPPQERSDLVYITDEKDRLPEAKHRSKAKTIFCRSGNTLRKRQDMNLSFASKAIRERPFRTQENDRVDGLPIEMRNEIGQRYLTATDLRGVIEEGDAQRIRVINPDHCSDDFKVVWS